MGRLDDTRKKKEEADARRQAQQARLQAIKEQIRKDRELVYPERDLREEQDRLSLEEGRQLSEEFLDEVRTKHLEPNGTVYEVTTKRERVPLDKRGESWDWSEEEVISRKEVGRCFTIANHQIDPTTGQELVAEKKLVETLPETEIYRTSYVQHPLKDHDGLDEAMVNFLDQAR